jgi:hypothetical protein
MTYAIDHLTFSAPLTLEAYQQAERFQKQHSSPQKARQVYLNTLAIYAVNHFCKCMGIKTDLQASSNFDLITQTLMDVSDLELPNLGKLECRPVLPDENTCYIPPEAKENRIGYIAVRINEPSREATLLGFVSPLNLDELSSQIQMSQLKPLENLLAHLSGIELFKSDDPAAIRVRERLTTQSISEIVAQFERLYRTVSKDEWRFEGGDVLAGFVRQEAAIREKSSASIANRESLDDDELIECQDLAEELLEKLGEIWQD